MKMVTTGDMKKAPRVKNDGMKIAGVKICGLTTDDAVAAALAGGAAFVGFVVYPASPRNIAPADAARLVEPARGRAKIVAVTVDADDALIDQIATDLAPDYFQLHGQESAERVRQVKARTGAKVIRALRISTHEDIRAAQAFDGVADLIMYDARPPKDAILPGGNGVSFDWSLTAAIPADQPWLLAGGLTPDNVRSAMAQTEAPLLDVSSGVERSPGYKDPLLISAFLDAVRGAGQPINSGPEPLKANT